MTGPFGVLFGLHLTSFGLILVTGQFRQVHTYAGCRAGRGEPLQMLSDASHPQHCPYTGADFSGSAPDFLPSQRLHPCCLLRLILSSWSSLFPVVLWSHCTTHLGLAHSTDPLARCGATGGDSHPVSGVLGRQGRPGARAPPPLLSGLFSP